MHQPSDQPSDQPQHPLHSFLHNMVTNSPVVRIATHVKELDSRLEARMESDLYPKLIDTLRNHFHLTTTDCMTVIATYQNLTAKVNKACKPLNYHATALLLDALADEFRERASLNREAAEFVESIEPGASSRVGSISLESDND